MYERPGSNIERSTSNSEKLLASWKQGPVVLASGSSFKLENLRALGMAHATSSSVPEEVEEALFENVEGREMRMHEMVAAMVAREKVSYVVSKGVPDNALVCGFDTVVMETTGSLSEKKRRYLQKPETREQAAEGLFEYFTNLVEGYAWKNEVTKDLVAESVRMGRREVLDPMLSVGYPQSIIHITTGMAVRLPGAGDEIEMIPVTVRLNPEALYSLAALPVEEREVRIKELVEKALSVMDQDERWRSITTGIDYADPRIKEILGLTEAKIFDDMDESETGITKGMPQQVFDEYLAALAKEKSKSSEN